MWRIPLLLIALSVVPLLAGCGGSASDSTTSSLERKVAELEAKEAEEAGVTGEILFEAHWTKTFSFTAPAAETEAGRIKVGFTNPQKMPQNIAFENSRGQVIGETEPIDYEETTSVVADFKPGVYSYFSSVGNNRAKGMEGTLTVTR